MQSKERAGERPLHLAGQSGRAPQKKGLQLGGEPPRSRSRMGPALGPGLQGERSFPREAAPVPCRARKVESFTADPPPATPSFAPTLPFWHIPTGYAPGCSAPGAAPPCPPAGIHAGSGGGAGASRERSGAERSTAQPAGSPARTRLPARGEGPRPPPPAHPTNPQSPAPPPPGGAAPQKCVGRVSPPPGVGVAPCPC